MLTLEKQALRKIFKEKRLSLNQDEITQKSKEITKNFITNLLPKIYHKNSKEIFSIYLSSSGEVSCDGLAEYFTKNNIKFSYPKIIQKNFPLNFILAQNNQSFKPNSFYPKLLEPINGENILPNILILPLLAFDSSLARLGMGGGFFDRTIEFYKNQKLKIITIGLAYDFQRSHEALPIEKTDQKLDFIATESMIFSASQQ